MTLPAQTYTDTLQLLDGNTVVFDLNLRTGAGNPNTLKTVLADLDIGTPVPDREFFDDRILVREDYGPVDMSLSLHCEGTSYESLRGALGILAKLLKDPKHRIYWKRQGAGSGTERYIHFHSADLEPPQGFHALRESRVLNLPIRIIREPFLRGPEATLRNAVAVPNDPASANGLRSGTFTVLGDASAPGKLVIAETVASSAVFHIGYGHEPYSDDVLFFQAEAGTLGADTSSQAVSTASGGSVARTTFATQAGLVARITFTNALTAGQLTAIRGKRMRVALVTNPPGGVNTYRLRLEHGYGDFSNTHSIVSATSQETVLWLGSIQVPDEPLNRLDLRVLIARDSGSSSFDSDFILLMPADRLMTASTVLTAMAANDRLVLDAARGEAFVGNASEALKWKMRVAGPLAVEALKPGVGELVLLGIDNAAVYTKTRSHTVTLTYQPRYLT